MPVKRAYSLKNWRDTDRRLRHNVDMTLKTHPEFMKPLLSLLVIDKRNESGEGMRKSGRRWPYESVLVGMSSWPVAYVDGRFLMPVNSVDI